MEQHFDEEPPFTGDERPPGPPGDWTRLLGDALGGNFDTLHAHAAEEGKECVDWCPICRLADVLRANTTPEMREQWSSVQRELLLAARSVADHYLERDERRKSGEGPRIQDIPIE